MPVWNAILVLHSIAVRMPGWTAIVVLHSMVSLKRDNVLVCDLGLLQCEELMDGKRKRKQQRLRCKCWDK
jgi:hypothetical protein